MSRVLRWIAAPVVTAAAAFLFLAYAQSDDLPGVDQLSNELGVQNHCTFHSLQLPKEFVVYATGTYSGRETPYVIADSARPATEMQVYVNEPDKPVVLMLAGYSVDIWQVKWTPSTRIVAVYAGNYYPSRILGLAPDTPHLTTSCRDRCGGCAVYSHGMDWTQLNPVSQKYFGRQIDQVFPANSGVAYIGVQKTESAYVQAQVQSAESMRLPNVPLARRAGLDEALAQGLIRPATKEDIERWLQTQDIPPVEGGRGVANVVYHNMGRRCYVILKPFQIPAGLNGGLAVNFLLPRGVPKPTGHLGHSNLFDLDTGTCTGTDCELQ